MRTLFGSVALSVGGFLLLATFLTALQFPGVSPWVTITSGSLAAMLGIAGAVLLLRKDGGEPRRWVIVSLALLTGVAGLVFAIGSKNHPLGKHCGIEGR